MTALSAQFSRKGRGQWAYWAAAGVCILLLALLAGAQVTHLHVQTSDADHCPLCIAMHSAAPVAAAATAMVLVRIAAAATVYEPATVVRHRHSKLYTRPPPAGCLG
ncbi:MAG: hypothetical protein WCE75_03565 [Terracidiphilus sp.]